MKKILAIALSFLFQQQYYAQSLRYPATVPYWSARYSVSDKDAFARSSNPAALPYLNGFSAGVFSEKRFPGADLAFHAVCAAFDRGASAIAVQLNYFGNSSYNETVMMLHYGRSLGKINLGTSFGWQIFSIQGFEKQKSLHFGIASIWKPSERVYAGLQFTDPHVFSNTNREMPAAVYRMGFGCDFSSALYSGIEICKEERKPAFVSGIIQYRFSSDFYVVAGLNSAGGQPFFSAGWQWNSFRIAVMVSSHTALGASPAMSILYHHPSELSTK